MGRGVCAAIRLGRRAGGASAAPATDRTDHTLAHSTVLPPMMWRSLAKPALNPRSRRMCGIIAYIGSRQASPILVAGLKRLECELRRVHAVDLRLDILSLQADRGYDSAGVGLVVIGEDGSATLSAVKKSGKVVNLESALAAAPISSTLVCFSG